MEPPFFAASKPCWMASANTFAWPFNGSSRAIFEVEAWVKFST